MKRLWLCWAYVAVWAAEAAGSFLWPATYRFNDDGWLLLAGWLGAAVTVLWWGRPVRRVHWWLPVALIVIGLTTIPHTSRDPLRYLFDGGLIVQHLSPYAVLPYEVPLNQYSQLFGHIWWTAIPSPYGPLWQALMAVLNMLTQNTLAGGLVGLKLLNLAALLAAGRYLFRITRQAWPTWLLLVNPVVLANSVATPHTDIVLLALLLGAYYYRPVWVRGGLVAAAALIKPHMLLFLPVLAKTWRERFKLVLAAAGVLILGLAALWPLTGWQWQPMLQAALGGGLSARDSLLWPNPVGSLALLLAGYAIVLVLYLRRRITQSAAIAATAWLVPLFVTGLLLPWHFILSIGLMLLVPQRWALFGIVLVSALSLRSATRVSELVAFAVLMGAGYLVVSMARRKLATH